MSGNTQKTPIQASLNRLGEQKALDAIKETGRSLPCTIFSIDGQIVTVNFEVAGISLPRIQMPIATSKFDWLPLAVGDPGVAMAADVYLGGISGLGGGVADLTQRGNLTALMFVPISHTGMAASNPVQRIMKCDTGVRLECGSHVIEVNASGIFMTVGSHTVTITSAGISLDGIIWHVHVHGGVQSGSSSTSGPS